MKFLLTGATGLIGQTLSRELIHQGHELTILVRSKENLPARFPYACTAIEWDHKSPLESRWLHGINAVINLAGEPIAGKRWSLKQKARILYSRVNATQALTQAILKSDSAPGIFVSASAIGYYGDQGDRALNE